MAQTGYTPIKLYLSTTPAAVPTAGNLVPGELALNNADGKLFYKDSAGVLEVLTEAEWIVLEIEEMEARKPYPSWIYYPDTKTYSAPIPRPADAVINGGNVRYQWDEATLNWVPMENQA